jgi:hypothetical protein
MVVFLEERRDQCVSNRLVDAIMMNAVKTALVVFHEGRCNEDNREQFDILPIHV